MPKRKAPARISGLVGSDDEDVMKVNGNVAPAQEDNDERPVKRARGRPRSKSAEIKPANTKTKTRAAAATSHAQEAPPKKTTRRGRPRGSGDSRASFDAGAQETTPKKEEEPTVEETADDTQPETQGPNDEQDAPAKSTRQTKKPAATRGRKGAAAKSLKKDGEFEYTPSSSRQTKAPEKFKEQSAQPARRGRRKAEPEPEPELEQAEEPEPESEAEVEGDTEEGERSAPEVDETILQEEPVAPRSVSASPSKVARNRLSMHRPSLSPQKRRLGESAEPELRRKIGDLTKKHEALENRFRNLKEIGIVEANANMEKLRKQCEATTEASKNLVASLKAELEAQRALGQQSRALQKQLKERDAEVAQLKTKSEEATTQLSSAQSEVKALQTKLAAARSTAASLESAATRVPGSAIKNNGGNRANAAASAEAAHAAQFAQLKEDLYSDLTGLIVRDVKKREDDYLYDCIQTGINGTLHFKLAVPHVSSANFQTAEFQYIPLLDENRDRDLVEILPDYLTVDITFSRQQASKFYTRVIDTLTKRRNSSSAA
ncbi:hypothetical protein ASPWEDRAFT_115559 [Aspergillus wentii DTO 134E9]|uniref:Monopolin complex subunit Csm1/Pcs1 C-terminal domain-containing protein n=1 Tax=Aspergillus wentii DTO 134E9 TaxID=1073089 RepID=A0A1L9RE56_ASPWE|nr:uncharacterized protein ASPWEDRAFT_115559 [Aspergillus wentii DTO 134E9]OJJ33210.1 hypothetical protein ASPWEDRAFT_115559 [Aspergillus wentii DTO 134E9]